MESKSLNMGQLTVNVEVEGLEEAMEKLKAINAALPGVIPVKLDTGAQLPKRATEGAAAWDVYTNITEPVTVEPFERVTLETGVAAALPAGFYWDLRARSGLAFKHGLMLINGAGVSDEDYTGFIRFQYFNASNDAYTFKPGDRIGQAILQRYYEQDFEWVTELPETKRGQGGFGSTGKGSEESGICPRCQERPTHGFNLCMPCFTSNA